MTNRPSKPNQRKGQNEFALFCEWKEKRLQLSQERKKHIKIKKSPSQGPTLKILYVEVLFLENQGEEAPPHTINLGPQIFMLGAPLILYVGILYVFSFAPVLSPCKGKGFSEGFLEEGSRRGALGRRFCTVSESTTP